MCVRAVMCVCVFVRVCVLCVFVHMCVHDVCVCVHACMCVCCTNQRGEKSFEGGGEVGESGKGCQAEAVSCTAVLL